MLQRAVAGFAAAVVAGVALWLSVRARRRVEEQRRLLDTSERERVEAEERARELAAELDALTHSISHSLRSPLHAVAGFGEALAEDCADRLGPEGREQLARLRAAASRMTSMVDDLLRLSRLSRAQLRRRPVDVSRLAAEVAGGLCAAVPGRAIEVEIARDLVADGDPDLLRTCLEELLGNAVKFTRGRERPRVELGALEPKPATAAGRGGEQVLFVRDNGVGFDMTYVGRLFGVFQRLHRSDDYDGNGVGLAIVQRIVRRHGGRVWIEGAVGRGATVYFTLGGSGAHEPDG